MHWEMLKKSQDETKHREMHQIKHAKVNALEGNVLRFGDFMNIHKHYLITH
jgi:hypothetical protein